MEVGVSSEEVCVREGAAGGEEVVLEVDEEEGCAHGSRVGRIGLGEGRKGLLLMTMSTRYACPAGILLHTE